MKIIAVLPECQGYMPGAIIQVTGNELSHFASYWSQRTLLSWLL